MQVAWKRLYSKSTRDHGTLVFFRSLLNRQAVTDDPKDVNACVDLLQTVVTGHLLASACTILKIKRLTQSPVHLASSLSKLHTASVTEKKSFIIELAQQVVKECTINDAAITFQLESDNKDHIYSYARVLCHFGSILMIFRDAWAEGDGDQILQCWKVFMVHFFDSSSRSKYAFEAIRLLLQKEILSPKLSEDLVWNRFINSHGGPGKNIPCDLHNEHVNKIIKDLIQNMGPNLSEGAIQRAARSVSVIKAICSQFDSQSHVPRFSSKHSTRSNDQDIALVVDCVLHNSLLQDHKDSRQHISFPSFSDNPFKRISRPDILTWIEQKQRMAILESGL